MSFLDAPPDLPSPRTGPISIPNMGDPGDWYAIAIGQVNATKDYLIKLGQAAADVNPPLITPVFPTTPTAPPLLTAAPPEMQTIIWELPGLPDAFTGSLDVGDLLPEPFDGEPPLLAFPAAPAGFVETAPDAPGVNITWEDPTLELNLPAPPSLLSISTTKFSGLNFPTIDTAIPELTVVAPSVREYVPGALYTSALLGVAQSTLQRFITEGGTALPPEIERALWDRAREREYRAKADAIDGLEQMEELGYSFPPGIFTNARIKIETEMGYVTSMLSRDVAIEQAKLEQQNIQNALQQVVQLEGVLIQYNNQVEQRAFDSVKYATEAGIAVYNARVQAYSAYLDAYKTKVAVYEAQIRAEVARIEAYKAEIDAERVKADINTALIQQYKVQADVALANIEVYKAEIAGIQSKAEIEKLKIAIFGEQVRAYAAKVNAYTAGVEGFRAQIQAEGSKQEAFRSQVQAYSAQVDAAAKLAETKIEEYKGELLAKQTEWDGYKAAVQAASSRAQAIASINQSLADTYRAEAGAVGTYNEVLTKQWQVAIDQAQRVSEIGISAAKANAELFVSSRGLALESAKVGAQVSAQIGAAALNSSNWSYSSGISTSYSSANQFGQNWSYGQNYNYSASI
jgi:hypothetical protein